MKKSNRAKRIDDVLSLVELTAERKKYVRHYSGGMKKRLSLAVALLHEPEVLFLDEPTVGIDPVLRSKIWEQLIKIKEKSTTILVSTHVMDEVTKCSKAALIYNGRLIHYDTVDTLLAQTENGQMEELFFKAAEIAEGDTV